MTHQELAKVLAEADFTATASELHGLITGLIAGGMFKDSQEYLEHMSELFNNGLSIKKTLKMACEEMLNNIFNQLDSMEMSFELLLLDEDETLAEQAQEMLNWVQYFLVGFGLNQRDLKTASNEVREIIQDFTSITHMETDLEDNNDNQADFYEVIEFIRVSTVLCYQEFGKKVNTPAPAKTLH